jgi:hypothetical protein
MNRFASLGFVRGPRPWPAVLCLIGIGCADVPAAPPVINYTETAPLAAFQGAMPPAAPAAPTTGPVAGGPSNAASVARVDSPAGVGANTGASGGMGGNVATAGVGAAGQAGRPSPAGGQGGTSTAGVAAAGSGGVDEPAALKPTKLTFEFTTKSYRGKYAPKNVGAVWVEDTSGKWVYTLEYWGSAPNDSHLTRYNTAAGPTHDYALGNPLLAVFGGAKYVVMPPPDVLSGATLNMHKTHTGLSWSLKDANGKEAPDGPYRVVIEITEDEVSEKSYEVPFTKGPMPATVNPMETAVYTGVKLTLQ